MGIPISFFYAVNNIYMVLKSKCPAGACTGAAGKPPIGCVPYAIPIGAYPGAGACIPMGIPIGVPIGIPTGAAIGGIICEFMTIGGIIGAVIAAVF